MSMANCPQCGVVGFFTVCKACGTSDGNTLAFVRSDGAVLVIGRTKLNFTQAWGVRSLGEEARCWSPDGQFVVTPRDGTWVLTHNKAAVNETVVDGVAVDEITLVAGATVCVGRAATAVLRTPLIVKFV